MWRPPTRRAVASRRRARRRPRRGGRVVAACWACSRPSPRSASSPPTSVRPGSRCRRRTPRNASPITLYSSTLGDAQSLQSDAPRPTRPTAAVGLDRGGYTVYVTPKLRPRRPSRWSRRRRSPRRPRRAGRPPFVSPDPGTAQAIAYEMVLARGWGDDQFACLVALWNRESGWRVNAYNAGSGAYGIPQALPGSKMAQRGADWETNPATQITWGLDYIGGRYGTPCGAWDALRVRRLVLSRMPRSNRRRSEEPGDEAFERLLDRLEAHRDAPRRRVDRAARLGRSGAEGLRLPGLRARRRSPASRTSSSWRADGVLGDQADLAASAALALALLEDRLTWTSADPCCCPRVGRRSSCATLDELTLVGELALPLEARAGRDTRDAASAADRRRVHGLAHPAQVRRAAARPRRPRGAALQHARHHLAARHQRGRVRRRRRRGVRPGGGDGLRARARRCRARGWWAGRSAPRWR